MVKILAAILVLVLLTVACDHGNPVPAEAFSECYRSGGVPSYLSNSDGTRFNCAHPVTKGR